MILFLKRKTIKGGTRKIRNKVRILEICDLILSITFILTNNIVQLLKTMGRKYSLSIFP